jgi:hypothetical protein
LRAARTVGVDQEWLKQAQQPARILGRDKVHSRAHAPDAHDRTIVIAGMGDVGQRKAITARPKRERNGVLVLRLEGHDVAQNVLDPALRAARVEPLRPHAQRPQIRPLQDSVTPSVWIPLLRKRGKT